MKALKPEILKNAVDFLNGTGDYYDIHGMMAKLAVARKKPHSERTTFEVMLISLYQYFLGVANEAKTPVKETTND